MTHLFFTDPKTVQRLHDGPLRAYIDAYAARLQSQGYTGQCARNQIRLVADLSRAGFASKAWQPRISIRKEPSAISAIASGACALIMATLQPW